MTTCLAVVVAGTGCSSYAPEPLGISTQALQAGYNEEVSMDPTSGVDYPDRHETTAIHLDYAASGHDVRSWLVAWNGPVHSVSGGSAMKIGSSYSDTGVGLPSGQNVPAFYPHEADGTTFGDPGDSPTGGGAFVGLGGDVSLAPVTDLRNNGTDPPGARAILVSLSAYVGDVVAALTRDGGQTWGDLSYVNDGATGGTDLASGKVVDLPFAASNPIGQAGLGDTFVTWEDEKHDAVWLHQIWFDGVGNLHNEQPYRAVPNARSWTNGPQEPHLSFVTLPAGCTSGGEGVAVIVRRAAQTPPPQYDGGRCAQDGEYPVTADYNLYLSVYDVYADTWVVNDRLVAQEFGFPTCITALRTKDSSNVPFITSDPTANRVWITHAVASSFGTTPQVVWQNLVCAGGGGGGGQDPVTLRFAGSWEPSKPPDGQVHDEWMPSIAFGNDGTTRRVAVQWYGTRDDPGNQLANVYMAYSENNNVFTSPIAVGMPRNAMETVPWTATLPFGDPNYMDETAKTGPTLTWDYQQLAADYAGARFLAVWAGDTRNYSSNGNHGEIMASWLF